MKKLLLLTLIFTFFLLGLAISVNTSFGVGNNNNNNNNDDEEKVWCHKVKDDVCEEKKKDECSGDWKEGKCPAHERVCFCHNITHNPETICTDNEGLINGHNGHVEEGKDSLGECSTVVDQCSNIEGVQATVPENYYKSDGQCFPKTPVCADDSYDNYGGADHIFNQTTEVADNELCANEQSNCPANSTPNSDKVCTCNAGFHQVTPELDVVFACEPDVTPTPTPTTTQTNTGGPGDGRSDGRTDSLGCINTDCSNQQHGGTQVLGASTFAAQKQGAVLGASTFAGTGAFDSTLATIEQAIGFILSAGAIAYGKKKSAKNRK